LPVSEAYRTLVDLDSWASGHFPIECGHFLFLAGFGCDDKTDLGSVGEEINACDGSTTSEIDIIWLAMMASFDTDQEGAVT
jgi:hypothetical protein